MEWLGPVVGFLGVLTGVGLAALVSQTLFAALERSARERAAIGARGPRLRKP